MVAATREFLESDDDPVARAVPESSGDDYALVIGVNDYPKVRHLHGAIADARAFAAWLVAADGGRVPAANVHTIVSTPDPLTPIGHEINDALEVILERANETRARRFYFYFSGHGCVGDRASDISLCLANWSELRRRAALSSDAWLDVIVRSGAFAEVAFFLDCCRVWAVRAVGLPPHVDFARPIEREEPTRVFLAYATDFQRVAVESSADESSVMRGIFTTVLIDGLQGAAAGSDGIVTAESLKYHLEQGVKEKARHRGLRQGADVRNGLESRTRFGAAVTKTTQCFAGERPKYSRMMSRSVIDPLLIRMGEVLMPSRIKVPTALVPWLPEPLRQQIARYWLPGTTDLLVNTLPSITSGYANEVNSSSRLVVILYDNGLSGIGWSLHGAGIDIAFNSENTWRDGPRGSYFSAELTSGVYMLRWADTRDIVLHVYSGYDTQIAIDYAGASVRFESIRTFLLPTGRMPKAPTWELVNEVEAGLHFMSAPSDSIENIKVETSFANPLIGLLTAYRLALRSAFDVAEVDAITSCIEGMLGSCPDIHALRLRAAIIRGSDLPTQSFSDPPMFREGLLVFIEASHRRPEIVQPGSLLEHACVHRLVDSPISSCSARMEFESSKPDWLDVAVAEISIERLERGQRVDALTIAKQLGVPTLAVQSRMRSNTREWLMMAHGMSTSTTRDRRQTELDDAAVQNEIKRCIRARDYDDALAVAETFLHIHPENKSIRRLAALCQQRREPPTHLVPRIVASPHELETTNFDNQSKRLLDVIDGRLPIDQVIDAYANDPQDVILAMFYLHQWVQRRIIEIVTVPAQPV